MIEQKASMYDKDFVKVSPNYTSKDCSICNYRYKELGGGIAKWICPKCNTKHDHDINATRNILNKGLKESEQLFGNEKHINV